MTCVAHMSVKVSARESGADWFQAERILNRMKQAHDAHGGASAIDACSAPSKVHHRERSKKGYPYLRNLECVPYLTLRLLAVYPT